MATRATKTGMAIAGPRTVALDLLDALSRACPVFTCKLKVSVS